MASLFHPLLVALSCLLYAGHVLGQPVTLTVSAPNSTVTPRQNGANALDIMFNPPVLQVTGELGTAASLDDIHGRPKPATI